MPEEAEKKGKGKPHVLWRKISNSLCWMLVTGARWCDLPKGNEWGLKSATHRWLGVWQKDGRLASILAKLKDRAEILGIMK